MNQIKIVKSLKGSGIVYVQEKTIIGLLEDIKRLAKRNRALRNTLRRYKWANRKAQ